jgi:hypothetical protein
MRLTLRFGLGVMRQLDLLAKIAVPKPVTLSSDGCSAVASLP